jgi:spore maturation protein CgeB
MVKRIALFLPPRSQYGVLHHFTVKLAEAFQRSGVETQVLEAEWNNPKPFLDKIFDGKPDCTLSFNGLLPDDQGRFFSDLIGIPHVAYLVDSQNQFFPLTQSKNTIVVATDRFACSFFKGIKCRHVLFVPHGIEKELAPDLEHDRTYDVTVLNSLIDYEAIRKNWKEQYPKIVRDAMDEAIEEVYTDSDAWYVQSFVSALDRQMELRGPLDPSLIDFISVLDDLEMYLKGKSRIDLIQSIKDSKVHVFGAPCETATWEKYLPNSKNVQIHEPVPYQQALEIIKQSKILINNSPWIRGGSHERILASMALETLVITDKNVFLNENFVDGKELVLYPTSEIDSVNDLVNEYLSSKEKREQITHQARDTVMRHHTWDNRTKLLIKELDPILESFKTPM